MVLDIFVKFDCICVHVYVWIVLLMWYCYNVVLSAWMSSKDVVALGIC
jgi:hypothetical protein